MPSPSTLTVYDRAATPVAFDFQPGNRASGVQYFAHSTGVKIGDKTITVSQRKAGTKYKPRVLIAIPIVQNETINGIVSPKVVRTAYADLQLSFDVNSSEQERQDIMGFMSSIIAPTMTDVDDVLTGLNYWYGG